MIEHPNSLLLHHCLQAANLGDRDTLRELWSQDIVWRVGGAGPSPWHDENGGEIKGADDIFEYLADLGDVGPSGVHTEIEDVMVSNERAAVLCRSTAEQSDRSLDTNYLLIAKITNRRIQEVVSVPIDPDRVATFWRG